LVSGWWGKSVKFYLWKGIMKKGIMKKGIMKKGIMIKE